MTRLLIAAIFAVVVFSSCSHSYYIFRHAEKATAGPNMSSDVPLTEKGEERAKALQVILSSKKIGLIYSTNTIRTKTTAQPTAAYFHLPIETYGPRPDSAFIKLLKTKKKNVLIVGHSNTVDDIVNMLCNEKKVPGDLDESVYDNLFVVTYKGKKITFKNEKILLVPQVNINPRF
jgi:broad specificity phosphatase PhoE